MYMVKVMVKSMVLLLLFKVRKKKTYYLAMHTYSHTHTLPVTKRLSLSHTPFHSRSRTDPHTRTHHPWGVVVGHQEVWHGEERWVHHPSAAREDDDSRRVSEHSHEQHAHTVHQLPIHVHRASSAEHKLAWVCVCVCSWSNNREFLYWQWNG